MREEGPLATIIHYLPQATSLCQYNGSLSKKTVSGGLVLNNGQISVASKNYEVAIIMAKSLLS